MRGYGYIPAVWSFSILILRQFPAGDGPHFHGLHLRHAGRTVFATPIAINLYRGSKPDSKDWKPLMISQILQSQIPQNG
jgi:hypothetical protein